MTASWRWPDPEYSCDPIRACLRQAGEGLDQRFFVRQAVIARLESGPLATHLPLLASSLRDLGYSTKTIRRYLRNADRYARWLAKTGVPLADAGAEELSAYRRSTASNQPRDRTGLSGLERVMEVLRPAGVLNHVRRRPADDWLDAYGAHQTSRHRVVSSDGARPARADCRTHLGMGSAARRIHRHQVPALVTMRGVLRYLVSLGEVEPTLLRSIPPIPHRSHAGVPKRLSTEAWQAIVAGCAVADCRRSPENVEIWTLADR